MKSKNESENQAHKPRNKSSRFATTAQISFAMKVARVVSEANITRINDIAPLMESRFGIVANQTRIARALDKLGAVKYRDEETGATRWIIPSPSLNPDGRHPVVQMAAEFDLRQKIQTHVIRVEQHLTDIYLHCDYGYGPILEQSVSVLPWEEILVTFSSPPVCWIRCRSGIDALSLYQDILSIHGLEIAP